MEQSKLPFHTKFWFGFGQAAEGMKNAAFGTFLLLFYSQVLGLPAYLAGLALMISLVIDAFSDPLTGSLSDALRHRWGRRHPFMYASALPLWFTFAFAFAPPPDLGHGALFAWMLLSTIAARGSMALYHVPHLALGAELSDDYHERTAVVAWRLFFGLFGTVVLLLVCQRVFLTPTPEFPNGELNPGAYRPMAWFFGGAMAVAIVLSALGTHSRIPYLSTPAVGERFSLARLYREIREALSNPSFAMLFAGVLIFFVARGVADALGIYMGTFFWRLTTRDVLLIPLAGALGVTIGTPFFTLTSRRLALDKKHVFVLGIWWFSIFTIALPLLKIVGFYPEHGSALYLPLIYAFNLVASFGAAASLVASGSMMADIADEHELTVGRRQEGIFFGALSFSGKAAVGLGSAMAGFALTAIEFPRQVAPSEVPESTVLLLGVIAGPGVAGLMIIGNLLMARYRLTRERVAEIHHELVRRRGAPAAPSPLAPQALARPAAAAER